MCFDIDKMNLEHTDAVIDVVCSILRVERELTGIACSGNGLHFYIRLPETIKDVSYFKENKVFYKAVAIRINKALEIAGLEGSTDTSVFDAARLMRVPGTKNIKPGRPDTEAYIINSAIEPQDFSLQSVSGIDIPEPGSHFTKKGMENSNIQIDEAAVIEHSVFLKYCNENQATLSEKNWYAMFGILAFLPKTGRELAHKYSENYPGYTYEETELKFQQAKDASGPRTCEGINQLDWPGNCDSCSTHGKDVRSPILIQGSNFVQTEKDGFYFLIEENGKTKRIPDYIGLEKKFKSKHKFKIIGADLYYYEETHWVKHKFKSEEVFRNFALDRFRPICKATVRKEFYSTVFDRMKNKAEHQHFLNDTVEGLINLQNGVLNTSTRVLEEHNSKFGFNYCLDYEYNKDAKAPKFLKFLDEVTEGDKEIQDLLLEYMGYALSNDPYKYHKVLFLYGHAGTGKSTLAHILQMLVPTEACSDLKLEDLKNDQKIEALVGKLFNVGDETAPNAFKDCESVFKSLSSGNAFTVKNVFEKPYSVRNKAKLIFIGNKLPNNYDTSDSLNQRLRIVPFNKVFRNTKEENVELLNDLKEERSGILTLALAKYAECAKRPNGSAFTNPEACEEVLAEYKEDNDSVSAWLAYGVEQENGHQTKLSELMQEYEAYCAAENLQVIRTRPNEFSKLLRKEFPNASMKRTRDKGKRTMFVYGIKVLKG